MAFTSKQLCDQNLVKSTYEKEMMTILHAVETWCLYLIGMIFQIKTDHQNLKYFLEQSWLEEVHQEWMDNTTIKKVIQRLQIDTNPPKGYIGKQDTLRYKGHISLIKESTRRNFGCLRMSITSTHDPRSIDTVEIYATRRCYMGTVHHFAAIS